VHLRLAIYSALQEIAVLLRPKLLFLKDVLLLMASRTWFACEKDAVLLAAADDFICKIVAP
jgi:hypothetical protein